jgi:hypothetical protein
MNVKYLMKLKDEKNKRKNMDYAIKNHPIKQKSKELKNIILDMDKTLIEGYFSIKHDKMIIEERPYLGQFLNFVFNHFEHVSIWTNANKEWFDHVYEIILYKYIPKNKHFDFVITFDDGYVGKDNNGAKDLNVIFNIFEEDDYNKYNTFLVDDSETHYNQNPHNCYLIKGFNVDLENNSHKDDIELLRFIKYFRK